MRDGSIPAATSASSSVARSSAASEFASLVVPNGASPQFCDSNHLQCAMNRCPSGERSALNGVRTGARTPRMRARWIMVSRRLFLFRPNRALVSTGLGEMKPASTGERENIFNNLTAKIDHSLAHLFQVRMIKDDQQSARADGRTFVRLRKPARDPAVLERSIIRAVIREFPAEQLLEELFCCGDVCRLKLNVIDFISSIRCHSRFLPKSTAFE